MTEGQRRNFNKRLDGAIDEAHASLRPLFDTVNGAGAYHLPAADQELLHEIMFKLGTLCSVIIHRDEAAQQVHARWLDVQAMRHRARCKFNDAPADVWSSERGDRRSANGRVACSSEAPFNPAGPRHP